MKQFLAWLTGLANNSSPSIEDGYKDDILKDEVDKCPVVTVDLPTLEKEWQKELAEAVVVTEMYHVDRGVFCCCKL